MAYVHSRGIVHRDLKPGNIMLGDYGETLVVDWGLAKPFARTEVERSTGEDTLMPAAASPSEGATQMGQALGTPAYMSPEQAAGRLDLLGPASDIYSLGATLYVLLAGRPPFQEPVLELLLAHVQLGEFPPPRHWKPAIPRPLEAICLKTMALQPGKRYGTALELAADVEQWLADQPVTAYREPLPARLWRWGRRHKTAVATGTAMVLTTLLVGMAGLAVINRAVRAEQKNTEAALEQVTTEQEKTQAALTAETAARKDTVKERDRAVNAEKEAKRSEEDTKAVLVFFQDKVLKAGRPADQAGGQGIDVTLREAVDKAEPKISEAFKDRPLVEASIRDTLGTTHYYLFGRAILSEPATRAGVGIAPGQARNRSPGHTHISQQPSCCLPVYRPH
jgi:hypothetical protein